MELGGKVALVTGSAKRLGRAIALALGRAGANVIVHYNRSAAEAAATAEEIRALGVACETVQADLAQPARIEAMFAAVAEKFDRLDVLVNSASVFNRTPLESLTAEQWDAEFAVNARAPALCIRCALPLMGEGGAIINITDISADRPWAGFPAYCASKAALLALTRSAARALAGRNIRVNAVAPGVIDPPPGSPPEALAKLIRSVPLGRRGQPEDIAAAVVFLARQDYITGQAIRVDGGKSIA